MAFPLSAPIGCQKAQVLCPPCLSCKAGHAPLQHSQTLAKASGAHSHVSSPSRRSVATACMS